MNKLKDQIKEILSEDTKKDIETEYVREKMGNTEARNTRVNICIVSKEPKMTNRRNEIFAKRMETNFLEL